MIITMQAFVILAIIGTEKDILVFYLQSQWRVKCSSRVPGHDACL